MNIEMLIAFTIGMIILAASPGPGVFATVSTAITFGFRASMYLLGGLVLGDVIFLILALAGMTAISKMMGELFFIIKIAGGIYLIYLGIKLFKKNITVTDGVKIKDVNNINTLFSGLFVTMGNPKPILFYACVVPTIINIKEVHLFEALAMIGVIISVSFLVIGAYCYIASKSKKLLIRGRINNKLNKAAGFVLCTTGAYLIIK
jgi:threonine/homoserine/homoserine lactone efflux protein